MSADKHMPADIAFTNADKMAAESLFEALNIPQGSTLADILDLLNWHIKDNPDSTYAYLLKADILAKMERWEESVACMNQVWDPTNASPADILVRAARYGLAGDTKSALDNIDAAQQAGANEVDLCRTRAGVMLKITILGHADKLDESLEWALRACRIDKNAADCHAIAANILTIKYLGGPGADSDTNLIEEPNVDEDTVRMAIKYGKRAVDLGDKDSLTYYNLGKSFAILGKHKAAIKYFKRTLDVDSDFTDAHVMIATLIYEHYGFDRSDMSKKAIRHLDRTLKLDPSHVLAIRLRGQFLLHMDRPREAYMMLRRLIKMGHRDWHTLFSMGTALTLCGRLDRAQKYIDKAHEQNPELPTYEQIFDKAGLRT